MSAVATWQQAEADALEVRADNIGAAILALDRLGGMFTGRGELVESIRVTTALLATEEENVRHRVEEARR